MKKVLVFGTFDKIHKGHINFLNQARKHGDYLIAVVARDSNVKKMKSRLPLQKEKIRAKILRKFVDKVILGQKKVNYKLIKKINPNTICIGYDQKPGIFQTRKILKKLRMKNVNVKKMKPYRPNVYKSSILREKFS
jgi:cytidyltransferase-like protein